MADLTLVIDPGASPLDLTSRANGWRMTAFAAPTPESNSQYASNADSEGAVLVATHYGNRVITARVLILVASDALLQAQENILGQKINKLRQEGGTLRLTYPTADTIDFTVLEASASRVFDPVAVRGHYAEYDVAFTCLPLGLGTEVDLGDNTETTLPVLIFTEAGVTGDVPGLGRLVIDDDSGTSQWWLTWGIQSRYYSSSANAALFYEAEGRTAMGGSATAVGPSGASGAGSNVMRNTSLATTYQAILSTQATGAGAHLSHVGTFRAYARVQVPTTNTGEVTVALEWGEGDFRSYTQNLPATTISAEQEGRWRLVDLGLVSPRTVAQGTQRWEGRVIAKSTISGDDIDIDYLFLVPADEGSGIAMGVDRPFTPTVFSARDDFTGTTSGVALNTRTPLTGAAWATSGAATDFAFIDALAATSNTTEAVSRSVTTSTARYAVFGSALTDMEVTGRFGLEVGVGSSYSNDCGLIARYVDDSNHLRLSVEPSAAVASTGLSYTFLSIWTVIAGTPTNITPFITGDGFWWPFPATYLHLSLLVRANGVVRARVYSHDGVLMKEKTAFDSALVTGGALDDGKGGIYDTGDSGTHERWYDDITVAIPPTDAAIFASQSIEVRHDRVTREDSGGGVWSGVSSYQGDYLTVPPAGQEARTSRLIVKASRNNPLTEADPTIDDISARLFVTPRYLTVPD